MDNKVPFRMSSAGGCPKAIVAERLGHKGSPMPEYVTKAAEEGKMHEIWIKNKLRSEGYIVRDCAVCPICKERFGTERNGIHVEYDNGDWIAIGHIDAELEKNGLEQGGEIKSRSHFEYQRWLQYRFSEFPNEAAQITLYMASKPFPSWLYFTKNRSSGYDDRMILTEPPLPLEDVKAGLSLAAKHINLKTLPDIEFSLENIQCQRCRLSHLCVPEVKKMSLVNIADLESAAVEWRKGDAMERKGKALVAIAKAAFEKYSKECGFDKWSFEGLVINYIHVKAGVKINADKLKELFSMEQLAPAIEPKDSYSYIKVADKKPKEDIGDATIAEE